MLTQDSRPGEQGLIEFLLFAALLGSGRFRPLLPKVLWQEVPRSNLDAIRRLYPNVSSLAW